MLRSIFREEPREDFLLCFIMSSYLIWFFDKASEDVENL